MSTPDQDTAPGLERVESSDFQRSNAPDVHREVMDMIGEDPDTVQRPGFSREVQDVIKNTEQVIAPSQRALAEEVQAYCNAHPEAVEAYERDNAMRAAASEDDAVAGLAVADVVFDSMERGGVTRYQRKQSAEDNPLAALLDALPEGYENDPEPRKLREVQVVIRGDDGEEVLADLTDDEEEDDQEDDDDGFDEHQGLAEDEPSVDPTVPDNHRISSSAAVVDERETQKRRSKEGVISAYGLEGYTAEIPPAPDLQKQYPELDAQVQMPEDDAEVMQTAQGTTVVQDRDNGVSVAQLQKSLQGIATLAAHAFSGTPGCKTLEMNLDTLELHEGHTRTRNGIMSGYAAGFEDGYRTAIRRLAELDPLTLPASGD